MVLFLALGRCKTSFFYLELCSLSLNRGSDKSQAMLHSQAWHGLGRGLSCKHGDGRSFRSCCGALGCSRACTENLATGQISWESPPKRHAALNA
eukprot:6460387-Amphidinium_carterae.1